MDPERLFADHGRVDELDFDDELRQHLATRAGYTKHHVRLSEIQEVLDGAPRFFLNRAAGGRAPIVMVGPTEAGRFLTVPLEPTGRFGVWRPVTAFQSNTHHREAYLSEVEQSEQ